MGGAGGGGGNTTYGMARGMTIMPPRVLDIALYNRLKPGVEAAQLIPPGARMGDKLPLLPPPPAQPVKETEPSEVPEEYKREDAQGSHPDLLGLRRRGSTRPAPHHRPGAGQSG
jgi:hypothetical protein